LGKFDYNGAKIKILHSQKHSISYDYDIPGAGAQSRFFKIIPCCKIFFRFWFCL